TLDAELKKDVLNGKKAAWEAYLNPIKEERTTLIEVLNSVAATSANKVFIEKMIADLNSIKEPIRKDNLTTARKILRMVIGEQGQSILASWIQNYIDKVQPSFSSHLMSQSANKAENVVEIKPVYDENTADVDARLIIKNNFDKIFETYPETLIFGEDSGNIGDVNQGLEGLQEKYGVNRVADAGIREATILGQGIGMAMRGLRPIAEIQYLDYLLYALQIMSDDLATVQYRTAGKQKAPLIVRTRGHRLEGIWHSGSPMGMIINAVRGMYVCVPRNFVQAAGMYNTLLKSNNPAIVIESLNGYRLKEQLPENLHEITVPLGIPEILKEGTDITIVSYGSTIRIVQQAIKLVAPLGVSCELIDVQTLLPFDRNHMILESLKKTNRIVFVDEDVP